MKQLEDKVLAKMNLQRLKSHRTSVLANFSKEFYEYTDDFDDTRYPINHDTPAHVAAIAYRNKVNKYYFEARNKTKVK